MRKAVTPGMTGRILFVALAGFALTGCDQSVSGTYLPAGGLSATMARFIGSRYKKLEFESGDTAYVTEGGSVGGGTYKIDGNKVVMTFDGASIVFMIDDKGCLDGGQEVGKYCKK